MDILRGVSRATLTTVVFCVAVASRGLGDADATESFTPPSGAIDLRDALAAALLGSPELAASSAAVRAQEGRALQAGLLPNPELKAEVENIGGSGAQQGFESAETTLRLSQLIELGGKRSKRQALAGLERDGAAWAYEVQRAALLAHTAKSFVDVLALQHQLALAEERQRLAAESVRAVDLQVRAGAGAPAEAARARIAVAQAAVLHSQRVGQLAAARLALAATWGRPSASFERAVGDLDAIAAPPDGESLLARVDANPELARWSTELNARQAALTLAQARAVPDVSLGAGPRYFSDSGDAALVLEVWVPLPVFDRNQGDIAAARARQDEAEAARRASEIGIRSALRRAVEELRTAYDQIIALRGSVLPAAQAAFDATRDAYRGGALRSLDVLDAQRTLFELRDQSIEALAAYHRALIDVERLSGTDPLAAGSGERRP